MTGNQAGTSETSVIFSLRELADMEQERVQEEAAHRAEMERQRAQAERERQVAMREAEQARIAADVSRREQVEREKAEERAREAAREAAAVEVARIEAEARTRIEAESAQRAHELKVLQVKTNSGSARLRHAFAGVVALVLLGGSAAAWAVSGHVSELQTENQRLRDDRWTVTQAHDEALSSDLAALEKRHDALRTRAAGKLSEKARHHAEAARSAIEAGGVDAPKLRAFGVALDELAARVTLQERVADGDRRYADLSKWAHAQGKVNLLQDAHAAAARARAADADEAAASGYARALDDAADALAKSKAGPRRTARATTTTSSSTTTTPTTGGPCKNKHDPMCGFGGEMLDN